jgi:hypothetical protein
MCSQGATSGGGSGGTSGMSRNASSAGNTPTAAAAAASGGWRTIEDAADTEQRRIYRWEASAAAVRRAQVAK